MAANTTDRINFSKIKEKFNWKPKISIKKGVEMLLENINDWKKATVWTPKSIRKTTKDLF